MSILDWFKNKVSPADPQLGRDIFVPQALEKALTLTNPKLKLLDGHQEKLLPAVETSIAYVRGLVGTLPPTLRISVAAWAFDPVLRAFFAAPEDIPRVLGRSNNLRTFFAKYPSDEEACFILSMSFARQQVLGLVQQGEAIQREVAQTVISFSGHQIRICGKTEQEVSRRVGEKIFEYLIAQALGKMGEERSGRQELIEESRLIRTRLYLLQRQGPSLGSVFTAPPENTEAQSTLEAKLLANEAQLDALKSTQGTLSDELDILCDVLMHPERSIGAEREELWLSTMNVLLSKSDDEDVASEVNFSLAQLLGQPASQNAFVLARYARSELPDAKINFSQAELLL